MKLTLAEPKYFKESIAIISELVNEARFKITKDGIELIAMDPANVAMVVFKLLASSFVEYDVKEASELAINLGNLKQILRRAKPSDSLTLSLEDNKFTILLKSRSTRTFSLPIIDLDEREQKIPKLEFAVSVTTDATVLNDAIEDVDVVGESVTFSLADDALVVSSEGDMGKARIDIKEDEATKIDTKAKKLKAKYSVEYLKKMIVGSKIASTVSINFAEDYPLKLEYKEIDKVDLQFILAPRVEND